MRELSLFTGVGGGVWASKLLGHRVVGYVEIDKYCQRVIRARIDDGHFDNAPIFNDIRTFVSSGYAQCYRGLVDIISGGFPCQDISAIGGRKGLSGEKSGLWRIYAETIRIIQPRYVFIENSPMLIKKGLREILGDLHGMGFDARWGCLPASSIGAEHIRNRAWIFAYSESQPGMEKSEEKKPFGKRDWKPTWKDNYGRDRKSKTEPNWFLSESYFDRGIDDDATRKHRAFALGNGQVPAVAATAFRILSEGLVV